MDGPALRKGVRHFTSLALPRNRIGTETKQQYLMHWDTASTSMLSGDGHRIIAPTGTYDGGCATSNVKNGRFMQVHEHSGPIPRADIADLGI